MNRLDMAEEIARRVPMLAQRDAIEWKSMEAARSKFVSDYPVSRISKLSLDEYVIGRGSSNKSFCYRLERELDTLGRILGATAFKFGIYYGHTKSDPKDEYRFAQRWGSDVKSAFTAVKSAIVSVMAAAASQDWDAVRNNRLSPMLKGKLLTIYHPGRFAAVFSAEHLEHFVAELDLPGDCDSPPAMQRALMDYRNQWPALRNEHFGLYMRFLYDLFGYPSKPTVGASSPVTPVLAKAIAGAVFISSMPPAPAAASVRGSGKADPARSPAAQRQFKRIGDRGEMIVLALEKARLLAAGKPHLASRIDHVADHNDSAGYDILSFDVDGSERPIEVKSTTAPDPRLGFYITANEISKGIALPNYHIYFVFATMSASPKVLPRKKPDLSGPGFVLRPVSYHVTPCPGHATGAP